MAQTIAENCVSHVGNLVPIPGKNIMIQAWYQGGASLIDWTDLSNPKEIGYFDRGPVEHRRQQHVFGRLLVDVLVQRQASTARRSRAVLTRSS